MKFFKAFGLTATFIIRTDLDSSFTNANLEISMDIRNLSGDEKSGWGVIAEAYDKIGNNIPIGASIKLDRLNSGKDKNFDILLEDDTIEICDNINPNTNPNENISSNKYFTIKDDKGISSQNVEVDSRKQKWLLTNVSDNEVILTSENNDILFDKEENTLR
ncbi:hypothetical protein U3516DRAFT_849615 [Neocallimastix sp. 'constans']